MAFKSWVNIYVQREIISCQRGGDIFLIQRLGDNPQFAKYLRLLTVLYMFLSVCVCVCVCVCGSTCWQEEEEEMKEREREREKRERERERDPAGLPFSSAQAGRQEEEMCGDQ